MLRFLELDQADSGLKVGEIVLEACGLDVVTPRAFGGIALPGIAADAMEAEDAHTIGEVRIFGGDHAALAGSEGFCGVKGEASDVADSADGFAVVARGKRMSGVFDDSEIVATGDLQNGVQFECVAGIVNGEDGFGARGDRSFDESGVHVEGVRRGVEQNGASAEIEDDFP